VPSISKLTAADGRGIRGYSELIILEAIMKRIQQQLQLPAPPLPAEYFDLIAGTSAGGCVTSDFVVATTIYVC